MPAYNFAAGPQIPQIAPMLSAGQVARFRGGEPTDPNDLQQFSNFPSYLPQQAPTKPLQQFQQTLPSYFNTKPLTRSVNTLNQQIGSAGMAAAATAGAQSRARALAGGGSGLGSGLAAGSTMLPFARQQSQNLMELERLKAALRAQQAGMAGDTARGIAGMDANHMGLLSDFGLAQQRMARSADEFDAGLGLNYAQLAQQQRQFGDSARARRMTQSYAGYDGGDGATYGELATIMGAHNAALGMPMAQGYWARMQNAINASGLQNTRVNVSTGTPPMIKRY